MNLDGGLTDEFIAQLPAICDKVLSKLPAGYKYQIAVSNLPSQLNSRAIKWTTPTGNHLGVVLDYMPVSEELITDSAINWQDILADGWAEQLRQEPTVKP